MKDDIKKHRENLTLEMNLNATLFMDEYNKRVVSNPSRDIMAASWNRTDDLFTKDLNYGYHVLEGMAGAAHFTWRAPLYGLTS